MTSPNTLTIASTSIRRDDAGRFCLNDLHRAAGGERRHQPSDWLRLVATRELIAELGASGNSRTPLSESPEAPVEPVSIVNDGIGNGTYVCRELVYSYAMWISAAFHLKVIRAYDAMVNAPAPVNPAKLTRLQLIQLAFDAEQERLQLEHKVQELAPKADALDRIAVADGSVCISLAAKALKMRPKDLFGWLQRNVWIFRRAGAAAWTGYQHRIQSGLLEHKVTVVHRGDGSEKACHQVLVTPKGLAAIAEALGAGVTA